MTEISTRPWDPYYGDGEPKVVGPKDEYHEPYPGYWAKQVKQAQPAVAEGPKGPTQG